MKCPKCNSIRIVTALGINQYKCIDCETIFGVNKLEPDEWDIAIAKRIEVYNRLKDDIRKTRKVYCGENKSCNKILCVWGVVCRSVD